VVRRRGAALVLVLLLGVLAACGDDSSDPPAEDATATADTGGTDGEGTADTGGTDDDDTGGTDGDATDGDDASGDEAAAEAALLTIDDFPDGWQAAPSENDEAAQDEFNAALAACLDVDPAILDRDNPSAESDDFTSPEGQTVNSEVALTPSAEQAIEVIEILEDERTPECYGDGLSRVLEENLAEIGQGDLEMGDPAFERVDIPSLGDDAVGFQVTIPLAAAGQEIELVLDLWAVRVGRAGITMTFQSPAGPFPAEEAERLTRLVIDRLPIDV
jgi:hypothetical protein